MKPSINSKEFESAVSVEKMRKSDAYTIANFVESKELMFRAAMGVFNSVKWGGRIGIVCGSGNNAGDGYALGGILCDRGFECEIIRLFEKFSPDGEYFYKIAKEKGVTDRIFSCGEHLDGYDIIVDCILGTGFSGEPRGIVLDAIEAINKSGAFVVSTDINSGLNGDSGMALVAVRSDITVSVGFYKKGMFLADAPSFIGDLVNVDIGIISEE